MSEIPSELETEGRSLVEQQNFKDEYGRFPTPQELDEFMEGTFEEDSTDEKSLPFLFRKTEWEPYLGPSGGEGWKNPNTDEVVYQEEPPGDSEYQEFGGELEEGQILVFTDPTTNDTNMEEVKVVDSGTFDTTIEGPDGEEVDIPSQKLIDGVVAERGGSDSEQSQRGGINFDRVVSEQSLEEKLDKRLFGTASNMDVLEMEDGSEVFRVDVDDEETKEARDRTMTAYNFLEEIGGHVTEYDVAEDGSWFASREVNGEILRTAPDDYRDKIEKDHVTEVMAEQLIVGNWDAHPENLAVDENGQLQVFDFDNASSDMSEYENISAFRQTLSYVSGMVDDDIDMNEVTEKAEELVTQISLDMVDSVEGEKGSNSEFLEQINMNLGAIMEGEL